MPGISERFIKVHADDFFATLVIGRWRREFALATAGVVFAGILYSAMRESV